MKTSQLKYSFAVLGAAILLPMFAVAQPASDGEAAHCGMSMHSHGPHGIPDDRFMDGPMPPFVHGLNLSENQRDGIFKIMYEQMPLVREKLKQARKSEEALRSLTMSNQYDEAKAKSLAQAAADDMATLSLLRAQSEHQIYALLTPEQRKQVEEMKSQFDFHHVKGFEGKTQEKPKAM